MNSKGQEIYRDLMNRLKNIRYKNPAVTAINGLSKILDLEIDKPDKKNRAKLSKAQRDA